MNTGIIVLNELCSSMNSSTHLLRHFDVDRTDSEKDNLFGSRIDARDVIEVGNLTGYVPHRMAYWLSMFTTDHSVVPYTWSRTDCLLFTAKRPPKTPRPSLSGPFRPANIPFVPREGYGHGREMIVLSKSWIFRYGDHWDVTNLHYEHV